MMSDSDRKFLSPSLMCTITIIQFAVIAVKIEQSRFGNMPGGLTYTLPKIVLLYFKFFEASQM